MTTQEEIEELREALKEIELWTNMGRTDKMHPKQILKLLDLHVAGLLEIREKYLRVLEARENGAIEAVYRLSLVADGGKDNEDIKTITDLLNEIEGE